MSASARSVVFSQAGSGTQTLVGIPGIPGTATLKKHPPDRSGIRQPPPPRAWRSGVRRRARHPLALSACGTAVTGCRCPVLSVSYRHGTARHGTSFLVLATNQRARKYLPASHIYTRDEPLSKTQQDTWVQLLERTHPHLKSVHGTPTTES